jgi:hypothetical protein
MCPAKAFAGSIRAGRYCAGGSRCPVGQVIAGTARFIALLLIEAERTTAVVGGQHGSTKEGRLAPLLAPARRGLEARGLATEGLRRGGVSQWLRRARDGGEALTRRPAPDMAPRLPHEQRALRPALLA